MKLPEVDYNKYSIKSACNFQLKNAIGADWCLSGTAIIALWIYQIIYLLSCSAKIYMAMNLLYHKTTLRQVSFTVVDISMEQPAQHDY